MVAKMSEMALKTKKKRERTTLISCEVFLPLPCRIFLYKQNAIFAHQGSLFCSRQLKVTEMDGRAGAKNETARKRSAGAVDDQKWSKIIRPKKRNNLVLLWLSVQFAT